MLQLPGYLSRLQERLKQCYHSEKQIMDAEAPESPKNGRQN